MIEFPHRLAFWCSVSYRPQTLAPSIPIHRPHMIVNDNGDIMLNDVILIDTDSWMVRKVVQSDTRPRQGHCAAIIGDGRYMLVYGGESTVDRSHSTDVAVFDLVRECWLLDEQVVLTPSSGLPAMSFGNFVTLTDPLTEHTFLVCTDGTDDNQSMMSMVSARVLQFKIREPPTLFELAARAVAREIETFDLGTLPSSVRRRMDESVLWSEDDDEVFRAVKSGHVSLDDNDLIADVTYGEYTALFRDMKQWLDSVDPNDPEAMSEFHRQGSAQRVNEMIGFSSLPSDDAELIENLRALADYALQNHRHLSPPDELSDDDEDENGDGQDVESDDGIDDENE